VGAPRRKLIVVSNRGPVSFQRDSAGKRTATRGGGGLVTALGPLVSRHDVIWVASALTDEDRAVAGETAGALEKAGRDGTQYRLHLVRHDESHFDRYYNVFANPTLWFVQHRLWDLARAPALDPALHEAWSSYAVVNEGFAQAVLEELNAEPDAYVWLHDYHLYLVARLVRRARPETTLSHFVHIPWPDADQWTVLPMAMRVAIHDSLLANDVVGFHTERWRNNFLDSAAEIVGAEVDAEKGVVEHEGRQTLVTAHPISVDAAEFGEIATSSAVLAEERNVAARRPEHLILRVDRTDPSKNILRGFRAFELLLERYPELHGAVGMLALLDPSRQEIADYAAYLEEIERTVAEVNSRFATGSWQPITLEIRDDFPRSVAAYKHYDVLLVNAVFDGMNLVAKEAPLVNERDGVLVLSENTGTFEELGTWALRINPFDVVGQAEALHAALELPPPERRARAEAIRAYVRGHDLEGWITAQLADLDRVSAAARR
jgi:trehalose 6-phosphate synthase